MLNNFINIAVYKYSQQIEVVVAEVHEFTCAESYFILHVYPAERILLFSKPIITYVTGGPY